jgi:pyoverdine/dityrosine biosynthesis protein Dit1
LTGPVEFTFEDAWARVPPGNAMIPRRVERFDSVSKLLVAPIEYETVPFSVSDEKPSEAWVKSTLPKFVCGSIKSRSNRGSCPPCPRKWEQFLATDDVPLSYVEKLEGLIYGSKNYVDSVLSKSGPTMPEKIFGLLCDSAFGNRKNRKNVKANWFSQKVDPMVKERLRLEFVLPAFPFKDQSIFRTMAPPEHVDMGELAFMARLHTLALAIYQVHPYGVDWILVSDGLAYSKILRVDETKVKSYFKRLVMYRNLMGLQRTVHIIDLDEMTHRLRSEASGNRIFDVTKDAIKEVLIKWKNSQNERPDEMKVLARGMKWNVNLKDITSDVDWADLWLIMNSNSRNDLPAQLRKLWDDVMNVVTDAAIEYAAFNLAMKFHNVFAQFFPMSFRATIHPKKGQIAVPEMGKVFPWNGVALRRSSGKFESLPLYSLLRRSANPVVYTMEGSDVPFFYEIRESPPKSKTHPPMPKNLRCGENKRIKRDLVE